MIIGARIQERLEATNQSQSDVARAVGLNQSTINGLVRGGQQSTTKIDKLARQLKTTPAYLEGETDDPSPGAPPPVAPLQLVTMQVAMPSQEALAEMFGALLSAMPEGASQDEQAELLAERLPIGLSQLQGLMRMPASRPAPRKAAGAPRATRAREVQS